MFLAVMMMGFAVPVVVLAPGCALFSTVAPGNDVIVVDAERIAILSFTLVDTFLDWETVNRANVPKEATAAADKLRDDFPKAYNSYRAATKAYKFNRTADNQFNLNTAEALVQAAMNIVTSYLPPPDLSRAKAKAAMIVTPPVMVATSLSK